MPPSSCPPRLTLRNLGKSYAAPVLQGVDFDLQPGEVHALVGANGAGKSTMARIITGMTRPDSGAMTLDGLPYQPASKAAAERLGVQIVQQELNLIGTLSVAENVSLGRLPSRFGWVRRKALNHSARETLARVGLQDLDPSVSAERLGVGQQQLVEIATALARNCRVLILDEPTAALTDPQIDRLFREIDRLKAEGAAIIYISHRLDELRRVADRVSVLRDGRLVATRPAAELDVDEAVRLMVGVDPVAQRAGERGEPGTVALRVEHLNRGDKVRDVSFKLHRGEILGLAGLIGSGRTELLRAIFGADRADSGEVRLFDEAPRRPFRSPYAAARAGLGLVPEDRKAEGLLLSLPIDVNLTLSHLKEFARPLGWIDRRAETVSSEAMARRVELRCRSTAQRVEELSGGNQQKVVIGRWLLRDPEILMFDEPTRGIDVAAKFTVYALLRDLARRGKAVLVVSSELEELMALCDRIAVLSAGRLVRIFDRGEWSQEALLAASFQELTGAARGPGVVDDA